MLAGVCWLMLSRQFQTIFVMRTKCKVTNIKLMWVFHNFRGKSSFASVNLSLIPFLQKALITRNKEWCIFVIWLLVVKSSSQVKVETSMEKHNFSSYCKQHRHSRQRLDGKSSASVGYSHFWCRLLYNSQFADTALTQSFWCQEHLDATAVKWPFWHENVLTT